MFVKGDAGIADQRVDGFADFLLRLFEKPLKLLCMSDIQWVIGASSEFFRGFFQGLLVASAQDDLSSFFSKFPGHLEADATATSGNEDDLSCQLSGRDGPGDLSISLKK